MNSDKESKSRRKKIFLEGWGGVCVEGGGGGVEEGMPVKLWTLRE